MEDALPVDRKGERAESHSEDSSSTIQDWVTASRQEPHSPCYF